MSKISIVIPVYNKEKYLKKCLDSIIGQDFQNYEVIIVDDCSTDKSYAICSKYTENSNVKLISTQKNRGPGFARNKGLEIASGDYVTFIDADDWIDASYLSNFIKNMDVECDLLISGWREWCGFQNKEHVTEKCDVSRASLADYIFCAGHLDYFLGPCGMLYRRKIIKNNQIIFPDISYGEDTIFNFRYLNYCRKIKMIKYAGYNNLIVANTLSRSYIANIFNYFDFIDAAGEDTFHYHYDKNWSFFYLRLCKIALNQSKDENEFVKICSYLSGDILGKIINDKLSRADKFIVFMLRHRQYYKLYYLVQCRRKLKKMIYN